MYTKFYLHVIFIERVFIKHPKININIKYFDDLNKVLNVLKVRYWLYWTWKFFKGIFINIYTYMYIPMKKFLIFVAKWIKLDWGKYFTIIGFTYIQSVSKNRTPIQNFSFTFTFWFILLHYLLTIVTYSSTEIVKSTIRRLFHFK